jgi:transposase-like protein
MRREKPNTYTAEFKQSAVRLANASSQPVTQVAKELGINVNTLHTWIGKYSKAKATDKPERTDDHLYDELKRLRKEVTRLTEERDLLIPTRGTRKSRGVFMPFRVLCERTTVRYAWIQQYTADFCVNRLCRLMAVSRSTYYAWLNRSPTMTEKNDHILTEIIVNAFKKSRATYGTRRLKKVLGRQNQIVSRRRIGRLMRNANLACKTQRRFKATTNSKHLCPMGIIFQLLITTWIVNLRYINQIRSMWVTSLIFILWKVGYIWQW